MSAEHWHNAAEEMYCASVIPRRSVNRIRRAIKDGIDPEPFLEDIEKGMETILRVYRDADEGPRAAKQRAARAVHQVTGGSIRFGTSKRSTTTVSAELVAEAAIAAYLSAPGQIEGGSDRS